MKLADFKTGIAKLPLKELIYDAIIKQMRSYITLRVGLRPVITIQTDKAVDTQCFFTQCCSVTCDIEDLYLVDGKSCDDVRFLVNDARLSSGAAEIGLNLHRGAYAHTRTHTHTCTYTHSVNQYI